ncbi:MAG: electron transport complex subunit RsxC [Synergistaceae bacterium]|nr:electron transport complex subunit RsxC [Synergistaceae bacterium]
MELGVFKGGVHPPDNKALSADRAIERFCPEGSFVFPMSQHIGAPCSPVVKKGDRVLAGQKLGDAEAFVSAPVRSSVSGTVKDVGMKMTASGALEECVTVESDGKFEYEAALLPHSDFMLVEPKECVRIIREAGIVGMGGAAFPTHVKLSPPPDKKIQWIIANGAECEPFLNCDNRLMLEHAEEIVGGLEICKHIFPAAKGVIGVEDNKPEAIARLKEVAAERGGTIEILPHKVKYPQGAEKMLIYTVTEQEVPSGALPADVGCLVINVRTLYQIWTAIAEGIPVVDRVVSVVGDVIADPKNILAPLGASVRSLVEAAGGFTREPARVLSGGPMMGISMRSLDVPIVKGTSGILALSERFAPYWEESNCIRCAKCVSACPIGLLPTSLDRAVRFREYAEFESLGGMNCIECGCCTYVCPARRYLTQSCRDGKAGVMAARKKAQASKMESGKK